MPPLRIKPAYRTRTWSCAQVGDLVPRVATLLGEAGLEPGHRVMIRAVPRPEWASPRLGRSGAQATSVPVDVRTTDSFGAKVVAHTRPKLVLASK